MADVWLNKLKIYENNEISNEISSQKIKNYIIINLNIENLSLKVNLRKNNFIKLKI